jgi:hypothetical protein
MLQTGFLGSCQHQRERANPFELPSVAPQADSVEGNRSTAHSINDLSSARTIQSGVEYYFHSRVGLLAIVSKRDLPSAVELRINGRVWASYRSAEAAAQAVGLGKTNHVALDALPEEERPSQLRDWQESLPLHFKT